MKILDEGLISWHCRSSLLLVFDQIAASLRDLFRGNNRLGTRSAGLAWEHAGRPPLSTNTLCPWAC